MNFKKENITYREIGLVMLNKLQSEGEDLSIFSDYHEFCLRCIEMDQKALGDLAVLYWRMEDTPEFKQLLRVFHTLIMECTRGEYPPSYSVAQFLGEGFKRFHASLGK